MFDFGIIITVWCDHVAVAPEINKEKLSVNGIPELFHFYNDLNYLNMVK